MRIAIDSNILLYAEGVNGSDRQALTETAMSKWSDDTWVLPAQVCVELHRVLLRKARRASDEARTIVISWLDRCEIVPTDAHIVRSAMDLALAHRIASLDAIVLASAAGARCDLLLSEDMQDGFTWRGVTVRNPFAPPRRSPQDRPPPSST